jgi:conjugative transfer region protein TrbK
MMSFRIVIRGVAYVILAVALLATAIALNNRQYQPEGTLGAERSPATDNLDAELARCKALATEAANDATCKAVWQASRERFLDTKKLYRDRVTDSAPAALNQNQSPPVSGGQPSSGAPVVANRVGQPR